jgi:hypothetical protein
MASVTTALERRSATPRWRLERALPAWLWRDVLLPLVFSRALLAIAAMYAAANISPGPLGGWDVSSHLWVNALTRWDAGWYLDVALNGYSPAPVRDDGWNVAFSPLYPGLMRALAPVVGWGEVSTETLAIAGIIISNLALLVAASYLAALVRLDFGEALARRTVLFLLLFPTSFFFSAVYTESLFLALSVASFYYARRRMWAPAAMLAALACWTRPHGVLLSVPLTLEYLSARRYDLRKLQPDIAWLGLAPVAFAAWLGGAYVLTGDALAPLTAISLWGRSPTPLWQALGAIARQDAFDLACTTLFLLLVAASWWRMPRSYAAHATLFFATMVSGGILTSNPRYGLVLFPALIGLARLGGRRLFSLAWLPLSAALLMLLFGLFSRWHWVA